MVLVYGKDIFIYGYVVIFVQVDIEYRNIFLFEIKYKPAGKRFQARAHSSQLQWKGCARAWMRWKRAAGLRFRNPAGRIRRELPSRRRHLFAYRPTPSFNSWATEIALQGVHYHKNMLLDLFIISAKTASNIYMESEPHSHELRVEA
jgi:hypothetical protein